MTTSIRKRWPRADAKNRKSHLLESVHCLPGAATKHKPRVIKIAVCKPDCPIIECHNAVVKAALMKPPPIETYRGKKCLVLDFDHTFNSGYDPATGQVTIHSLVLSMASD